ncbi:hypothetical protein [Psychroserpens mesophilus]|uniref:hypothetical protein n=1 Tax=Psychroserpens mesophilus TaxID=325473 RepID=UPI00069354C5|nr:hypothetical protein [Psychroserpens mesophilus]
MPIDYLKILSKNEQFADRLFNNPLLDKYALTQKFNNKLDQESQIIRQATHIKAYKEILFCFFTKNEVFTKIEILIKPHYYFNDNLHNANDFTVLNCIKVLTEIKDVFGFPAEELIILNIEFGINFLSPIDCTDLISYSIYHEKNEFINSSDSLRFSKISFKHNKDGKANKYKQIKFYAKGLQFPDYSDINNSRFEIKSKERKYIKSLGIYNYSDLLRLETFNTLAQTLRLEFRKVLILDIDNNGQNLTIKELSKLNEYRNSYKWVKALQGSRNLFNKYKQEYFKLLDKTGNNLHSNLYTIINDKLRGLLKPCAISTPLNKEKPSAISDVYIIGNCTQPNLKRCPITGIDLFREKPGSKYIKTKTIKHLMKHNVEVYRNLCSIHIPNNGKKPKYESNIVSHLRKQIRNRYYNSNPIKQVGYRVKQYQNQLELEL